jgi:hypothetical protein
MATGKMYRSNTVEVYDSIQQDRRNVWSLIFEFFVARHINKRGGITRKWEPAIPIYILRGFAPTQRDGFNCGFYVIEMAKRILWHKLPRDSKYHGRCRRMGSAFTRVREENYEKKKEMAGTVI